jgi:hypothetical protein
MGRAGALIHLPEGQAQLFVRSSGCGEHNENASPQGQVIVLRIDGL